MIAFYKKQMQKYGEGYASSLYLLASFILALSGAGLDKIFDSVTGVLYCISDIAVIVLQLLNKNPKLRSHLLFWTGVLGAFIFLLGALFDDLPNAVGNFELTGAIIRLIANFIMLVASVAGVLTLFPNIKTSLPEKPGMIYLCSYLIFFIFAVIQFVDTPSLISAGYIVATLLWILAGNAIRLKYDEK